MIAAARWNRRKRIKFWINYAWAKLVVVWIEVEQPKSKIFLYELGWMLGRVARRPKAPDFPWLFKESMVKTTLGQFEIRANSMDMLAVSPGFERPDKLRLLALMDDLVARKAGNILFVDVGAGFGDYTIAVARRYRSLDCVKVAAFEPLGESVALLRRNIELNGVADSTSVHEFAAFDSDNQILKFGVNSADAGSSGFTDDSRNSTSVAVKTAQLQTIFEDAIDAIDVLVLKIDVEGVEKEVVNGAARLIDQVETYLMVEDCIEPQIVAHLETIGASFIDKLTPYNSWWKITH